MAQISSENGTDNAYQTTIVNKVAQSTFDLDSFGVPPKQIVIISAVLALIVITGLGYRRM